MQRSSSRVDRCGWRGATVEVKGGTLEAGKWNDAGRRFSDGPLWWFGEGWEPKRLRLEGGVQGSNYVRRLCRLMCGRAWPFRGVVTNPKGLHPRFGDSPGPVGRWFGGAQSPLHIEQRSRTGQRKISSGKVKDSGRKEKRRSAECWGGRLTRRW